MPSSSSFFLPPFFFLFLFLSLTFFSNELKCKKEKKIFPAILQAFRVCHWILSKRKLSKSWGISQRSFEIFFLSPTFYRSPLIEFTVNWKMEKFCCQQQSINLPYTFYSSTSHSPPVSCFALLDKAQLKNFSSKNSFLIKRCKEKHFMAHKISDDNKKYLLRNIKRAYFASNKRNKA